MASEVRHGDCLEVARGLTAESVDLVYVDPPFFTQKTHSLVTRDRATKFEFSDEWKSRAEYIEFLRARVKEFRRVLKTTGSLFFQCDTNASHHIRCLLDDVFGEVMFRSEIIWHYRRWSNSQRNPMPSHQTIFLLYQDRRLPIPPAFRRLLALDECGPDSPAPSARRTWQSRLCP